MKLVETGLKLDLAKAHSGSNRLLFVGDYYWDQINRPVSSRKVGGMPTKYLAKWIVVHALPPGGDPNFALEFPLASWLLTRRYQGTYIPKPESKIRNILKQEQHD